MDLSSPVIKAPLSDKDWNPVTEEHALASGNGILVYSVAKTQAEQALWKFAEGHPELNLTTSMSWLHLQYVGTVSDTTSSQSDELHGPLCGRLYHHPRERFRTKHLGLGVQLLGRP